MADNRSMGRLRQGPHLKKKKKKSNKAKQIIVSVAGNGSQQEYPLHRKQLLRSRMFHRKQLLQSRLCFLQWTGIERLPAHQWPDRTGREKLKRGRDWNPELLMFCHTREVTHGSFLSSSPSYQQVKGTTSQSSSVWASEHMDAGHSVSSACQDEMDSASNPSVSIFLSGVQEHGKWGAGNLDLHITQNVIQRL